YHLSAGVDASRRAIDIAEAIHAKSGHRVPLFVPTLEGPFGSIMNQLAGMKARNTATLIGSLFKVFLPYITFDTVFDNSRAVAEIGAAPTPFTEYCADLYRFAKSNRFSYPYREL